MKTENIIETINTIASLTLVLKTIIGKDEGIRVNDIADKCNINSEEAEVYIGFWVSHGVAAVEADDPENFLCFPTEKGKEDLKRITQTRLGMS